MRTIHLVNNRGIALCDDADYEYLSQFKWYRATPSTKKTYYAVTCINGKQIGMHRLLLNAKPRQQIDHKNGKGYDNRRENIRFCTHQQNQANQHARYCGSSKYRGVRKCKTGWISNIHLNGKSVHIGVFPTEKQAARAYDRIAKAIHGEFANTNF